MHHTHRTLYNVSDLYRALYERVFVLPAMQKIKERVHKDISEVQIVSYMYNKTKYGNCIELNIRLSVGSQKQDICWHRRSPCISFKYNHLVTTDEVEAIYFQNVGYNGKPIRPHGLIREETVKNGAQPSGRNQFAPWVFDKIFHSPEFNRQVDRVNIRLYQEINTL